MSKASEHASCRPQDLTLFHYGELDEADRLRTEHHLRGCESCRRELSQLRSALGMIPIGDLEITPEEIRAFNEKAAGRLRPRRHPQLRPALGWSVAAATAVTLMVTLYSPLQGPQGPPSEMALQTGGEIERLPEPELLLNLDLLENLDLLQELEDAGMSG